MPQTYAFQVSIPVDTLLPRDRVSNTIHLEHSIGSLLNTDLESMCSDIIGVYQKRYGRADREIKCSAYDTDAVPNYPRASVTVNTGLFWTAGMPREVALCLSYHGGQAGNKNERGRIFLAPYLAGTFASAGPRPTTIQMTWALDWYQHSNECFPDLGGVDWKFGVWSRNLKKFKQSQYAWVDDEWDTVRSRGLRATTRQSVSKEG